MVFQEILYQKLRVKMEAKLYWQGSGIHWYFRKESKRGHQAGYVDMGHIAASQNFFLADLPSLTILEWGSWNSFQKLCVKWEKMWENAPFLSTLLPVVFLLHVIFRNWPLSNPIPPSGMGMSAFLSHYRFIQTWGFFTACMSLVHIYSSAYH